MSEEESVGVHQPHDRFFKCLLEEGLMVRDLLERYLPSEVFYHGLQKNVPNTIYLSRTDLMVPITTPGVYGLAAQVPVVNYQQMTWQQIPTNRPASMLECCLKARIDPQWQYLQEAMQNLQVWGGLASKTIAEIQRYLLHQVQMHDSPLDVFYRIIQLPTFTPEGDTHMATLAEWIANTTPEMLEQQWLQEGRQEGHIEGLQVGLEQGQLQERRHLIQRLRNHGMNLETIASITGYSLEEIQQRLTEIEQ